MRIARHKPRPNVGTALAKVGAVLVLFMLFACHMNSSTDESQIAAQVNKGEISVHQIQAVLQRQPKLAGATSESAASKVLEVLIDQELAAQAATKQGLESDPSVVQSLQLAKRETLAREFHERVAAKAVRPSSDEIDRYYERHPSLFAERRLYTLQEFAVEADMAMVARLKDIAARVKGADAMAVALRELNLRFTTRQVAQAAEDVPLGLLELIFNANPGQSVVIPQTGGARIFSVLHSQESPVERRVAGEAITKYLLAEQQRRLVSQAMANLRRDAQVRYVGAFAKTAPAESAATLAPSSPAR